jgi:hypothetical protein
MGEKSCFLTSHFSPAPALKMAVVFPFSSLEFCLYGKLLIAQKRAVFGTFFAHLRSPPKTALDPW